MFLHELGDHLVLLNELGLEVLDLSVLDHFGAWRTTHRGLEGSRGLVEDLLDPVVNLAGLETELIGEVRDGFFADEMTPNDLGLLVGREMSSCLVHGTCLRWDPY